MTNLAEVQHWLCGTNLAGVAVPSTDEFISEFTPPPNRALRWVTGFKGSMGLAVISRVGAALFLDSRYLLQGAPDTAGTNIEIKPATLESRRAWLRSAFGPGSLLGFDPWVHSIIEMRQWRDLLAEIGVQPEMLAANPIYPLWRTRPADYKPLVVDYPVEYAGTDSREKCARLVEHVKRSGLEALLVADPEDVSWMLNARVDDSVLRTEVGDLHIVPSCASRAFVQKDGTITWFIDADRLAPSLRTRCVDGVTIAPPSAVVDALRSAAARGPVGADPRRTSAALEIVVTERGQLRADDTAARFRWHKHPTEIAAAKRVHIIDSAAVVRFSEWLTRTVAERSVSEFEAAEALESFRSNAPTYKGPSMPMMSASGASGAQPHYVPRREGSRKINDHPVFWMDSGGQYPGGTTDNTITLAMGEPEPKHVLAHTLVLKGYIALATSRVPAGTLGIRLDAIARLPLWQEGMDYGHNTGHGVGNFLNIHEGPSIGREPGPTTLAPLVPGVIVTNEPAYYADGDFGLRIESHMVVVPSRYPGYVEFETISRLPIDPRLVDFSRLSAAERSWLSQYHGLVLADLKPLLDARSLRWLESMVAVYASSRT